MSTSVSVELKQNFTVYFHDDRVWQRAVGNQDDWEGQYLDLTTKEEVAAHLSYHIGIMRLRLSDLKGFADLPDNAVTIARD